MQDPTPMQTPAPCAVEPLERRTLLSTVVVTSEADAGPGTFRAAVDRANADSSVASIRFSPRVDTVRLNNTVAFTGTQDLAIDGSRASVEAAPGRQGQFDLFVASGGGDLTLSRIAFRGGSDGVVVAVPAAATGTVDVTLRDAAVTDNAEFGLHVDDLNASAASVDLEVIRSAILRNGATLSDKDGIRVDERGAGGITATIRDSRLDANGAEGVELDEGGAGSVRLSVRASTFNNNGFFDPDDFDDGIDVDEADAGNVNVSIRDAEVNGNFDEGVDLNEEGDGSLFLRAEDLEANRNTDEGVALEEADAGGIFADLEDVRLSGNGADGFQAEEGGAGDLFTRIADSVITNNAGFGVKVVQETPGRGLLVLDDVLIRGNTEGGVDAENVRVVEHYEDDDRDEDRDD